LISWILDDHIIGRSPCLIYIFEELAMLAVARMFFLPIAVLTKVA
jgi:hypothetical protein